MKYGSSPNWILSNRMIHTQIICYGNCILDPAGAFW